MKKLLCIIISAIFLFTACEKVPESYEIEKGGRYEMTESLADFTVALNGKVLKFPCEFSYLESLDWHLLEDGTLEAGKYNLYPIKNGDAEVYIYLANFKEETVKITDATVCGIVAQSENTVSLQLAGGIKHLISTKEDVINVYKEEFKGDDTLKFEVADTSYITLSFENGKLTKTDVLNLVNNEKLEIVKTAPKAVENYKSPEYLSSDLDDFTFYLYGKTYTFPLPLSELIKGGFLKAGQSRDYLKPHETLENAVKITKGNRTITLGLKNVADYNTIPENCIVTSIESKTSKKLDMTLANGCRVGTTAYNLENTFGKSNFTEIKKSKEKVKYIYEKKGKGTLTVTANKDTGYITKIKFEVK